jgi:hypothetical protein
MRKFTLLTVLLLVALMAVVGSAMADSNRNFRSHLSGDQEVPAVDTKAQGQAIYKLNKAGDAIDYKLIVANIEGVTQAHIHCGAAGVNGPVVAFLFGPGPGVAVNGILAQGTLTAADVIPRPDSPECPGGVANFEELIAKMRSGDTYTNVHTIANPGGEVRGQIH